MHCFLRALLLLVVLSNQVIAEESSDYIEPFSPNGTLCLVGGGDVTDAIRSVFTRRGKPRAQRSQLVVIPTASIDAESESDTTWKEPWLESGFDDITVVHTRDRVTAESDEFAGQFDAATAVWITGGDQRRLGETYAGTATEAALQKVIERGGIVGGTSAGAAFASRIMIAGGTAEPTLSTGADLLPNAIIDQHFSQRNRSTRLAAATSQNPEAVGLGIDESTAVFFSGRSMLILGSGNVHVNFAATEHHDVMSETLRPGQRNLDWHTIVRTQRERMRTPFPADLRPRPSVAKGSLLIVGGGRMSGELWSSFFELAGGESARVVVFPTAVPNATEQSFEGSMLRRMGVEKLTVLPAIDYETVSSEAFLATLDDATGIWFSGGRQWRFVDAYENTGAVAAMHRVLERGGVIGGSSAGASIQGDMMMRGAPIGNQIMVQDGYRRGFGFFPGVGIDQHFSQRGRFADLESATDEFPSVLGIGIDESTALVVQKSTARVIGAGNAFFYDYDQYSQRKELPVEQRPIRVPAGESVDLAIFVAR
jgi:cyanophycinase